MITYKTGNDLELDAVIELYRASTLGERRPVDERERMAAMLSNANLIITAWDGEILAGISRALTDFCYVTYLADLAVRVSNRRQRDGNVHERAVFGHAHAFIFDNRAFPHLD